jgi:hypothetical protein
MGIIRKGRLALLAASAAALLVAPSAFPSLVGYWTLNEGKGTTADDSSGNRINGSVLDATWVDGKFKSGLQFDGDDALQVSSSSTQFSVLEPQSLTVEAWVKRNGSPGPFKYIVAKGDNACFFASYGLYSGETGGLQFYVSQLAAFQIAVSPDAGQGVWDGAWHHVAGTYDGSFVRLFVDGAEVGAGTASTLGVGYGLFSTNDLFAGAYNDCGGANNFTGALDELRIWSRALGAAEIAASAAMGASTADEIKREGTSREALVVTSHFTTPAGQILISLESSSGSRTISEVRVEAAKKGTFGCDGTPCSLILSNGGRTASVAVNGTAGTNGRLRVTLDNGSTFASNVAIR